MAHNPKVEILPLVLGILGFTFGSLLGVFLVAVLTRTRGSDAGNLIAMTCGIVAVLLLSNVLNFQGKLGITNPFVLSFPWRITCGTLVTVAIALLFTTPLGKQTDQHPADES